MAHMQWLDLLLVYPGAMFARVSQQIRGIYLKKYIRRALVIALPHTQLHSQSGSVTAFTWL